MYVSGDSTITPRHVIGRDYRCAVWCEHRHSIEPLLKRAPWVKLADVPFLKLMPKMKCSRKVNGRRCGGRAVEVRVWRMTGRGSQTEEVLKLSEGME